MATLVKVRRWGNSLGLRLPKSFASERSIVDGATLEIDNLAIVEAPTRRRSRYKLKRLLKNYTTAPPELDLPRVGKELT